MWKLLNILFGWDYIAWSDGFCYGIARVYMVDDKPYFIKYKSLEFVVKIESPNNVIWMTCSSKKYFKESK